MLVTSQFVVLNVPKSGSSFVREVIKSIYKNRDRLHRKRTGMLRTAIDRLRRHDVQAEHRLKELILPNIRLRGRPADQHGTYVQVPGRFRNRAVIAVIRNPYDKLVSDYEFRWWAKYPPVPRDQLRNIVPNFPDLSFEEYLRMSECTAAAKLKGRNPLELGNLTIEFVQFFFKNPPEALGRMSDSYVASGQFRRDMAEVIFLRQERLNEDLADVLGRHGFQEEELELCRSHPRVNETVSRDTDRASLWTPWSLHHVRTRERLLLLMLEKLGFHCAPPQPSVAGVAAPSST